MRNSIRSVCGRHDVVVTGTLRNSLVEFGNVGSCIWGLDGRSGICRGRQPVIGGPESPFKI
jgi:hypothetical protein